MPNSGNLTTTYKRKYSLEQNELQSKENILTTKYHLFANLQNYCRWTFFPQNGWVKSKTAFDHCLGQVIACSVFARRFTNANQTNFAKCSKLHKTWKCTSISLGIVLKTWGPITAYFRVVLQWHQWRRYTRARQVKWPDWKIHRPGFALLIALLRW